MGPSPSIFLFRRGLLPTRVPHFPRMSLCSPGLTRKNRALWSKSVRPEPWPSFTSGPIPEPGPAGLEIPGRLGVSARAGRPCPTRADLPWWLCGLSGGVPLVHRGPASVHARRTPPLQYSAAGRGYAEVRLELDRSRRPQLPLSEPTPVPWPWALGRGPVKVCRSQGPAEEAVPRDSGVTRVSGCAWAASIRALGQAYAPSDAVCP